MTHRQNQGQPYGEQWPQQPAAPQGYSQPWPQANYDQQRSPRSGFPAQEVPSWQQPGARLQQMPLPPRRKRHIIRNVLAAIGGLVVVIVIIAVVASAGHHTVNTTGSSAGNPTQKARIGTAITLAGNDNGEQMAVTVAKVITSARAGDVFTQAPKGDRLYAVQFRLADTGSAAYSDSPENGASVTDSKGQSYDASLGDTAAGCQSFPGTENIASGASGLGCVVFEVPKSAEITQVQFTLDSGFGPQTGQWDVGR